MRRPGRPAKPVVTMRATHLLRCVVPPRFNTMPLLVGIPKSNGDPVGRDCVSVVCTRARPPDGSGMGQIGTAATFCRYSSNNATPRSDARPVATGATSGCASFAVVFRQRDSGSGVSEKQHPRFVLTPDSSLLFPS